MLPATYSNDTSETVTPSPVTPGGMKGVGESGTVSAPAAVGNAVAAALPEVADRITATPLTPYAVWSALHGGAPPGNS
jgi:carbon-monoxide dehydrogenase large subunit